METKELKIIEGNFALVFTGNATWGWVIDDEKVELRAKAALNGYFGEPKIAERGHFGFGVAFPDDRVLDIYNSKANAEESIARRLA